MINIFEEALALQAFLEESGYKFCFIGGIAVQRWGEVRVTNDIDLTLLTRYEKEDSFIDSLLSQYNSRISNARDMALAARVLLLISKNGVGIDIALGGMPFEESSVERSSFFEMVPGIKLRTCSAEDLIVHKAFASRPKDWGDLEGILLRNRNLDWQYVETQLVPLLELKEEPHRWTELQELRHKLAVI